MSKHIYIETYGCQMNVADTEVVAAIMGMAGYELTDDIEKADAVLLNTCSIRDNAEQKIVGRLQFLASLKRKRGGRLIVGVIVENGTFSHVGIPRQGNDLLFCALPLDHKAGIQGIRSGRMTGKSHMICLLRL